MPKKIDYIPSADGAFDDFQDNFVDVLVAKAASWGISNTDVTDLQALQNPWESAWGIVKTGNFTRQQRIAKDAKRKDYEKALRTFVQRQIRRNPLVTADDLGSLQVPLIDTVKTPQGLPATLPQVDSKPETGHLVKLFFR